jgi:hypothetical protein
MAVQTDWAVQKLSQKLGSLLKNFLGHRSAVRTETAVAIAYPLRLQLTACLESEHH